MILLLDYEYVYALKYFIKCIILYIKYFNIKSMEYKYRCFD